MCLKFHPNVIERFLFYVIVNDYFNCYIYKANHDTHNPSHLIKLVKYESIKARSHTAIAKAMSLKLGS